jgi:hypothetical protein
MSETSDTKDLVAQTEFRPGSELGKKAVQLAITVVGLLLLRAILASLPVLKNASALDDSLISPLVMANAVIDTVIFVFLLGFGIDVGRYIRAKYAKLPELGQIVSLAVVAVVLWFAYRSYQMPIACAIESPADLINLSKNGNTAPPQGFANLVRAWQQAVQSMTADAIHEATGNSLRAYQHLAVAVFRQSPDLYGWTFLILIVIPLVGIVVLVSRNREAFAELVIRATSAPSRTADRAVAPERPGSTGVPRGVPPLPKQSLVDAVDKLIKLKGLLDADVISKQDFEAQKVAILQRPLTAADPDDLRKLKSLSDAGALTQEEYEFQKQRFLSQL